MSILTAIRPASTYTTVVLDIAPGYRSKEAQETLGDFILHLVERGYQIFLCVTTSPSELQQEYLEEPGISYLREAMPPSPELLAKNPAIAAPTALWITDDARLQDWIRQRGVAFAFPALHEVSFAPDLALTGFSDLAALLDPTLDTVRAISEFVVERRHEKAKGALLVGVGGPPESGFQRFAVQLKPQLESDGAPLVELLDLTAFLRPSEEESEDGDDGPWRDPTAGRWLMDNILGPLKAGQRVYFERRPEGVPVDFDAHFPLFLSEESVIVVLGEMLFAPPVREALDVSILIEVSKKETTRRLYEIGVGEVFDAKFTNQYMTGQGGRYKDYLDHNQVLQRSTLGIDGNRPLALTILPRANA